MAEPVFPPEVAILGAGPHGRSLTRTLAAYGVYGYLFDDALPDREPIEVGAKGYPWVIGAAWPWVRADIDYRMSAVPGVHPPYHNGTVIQPGAQVSHEARFGTHVHVCHNAVVSHGCDLGDFVTVFPGAILCGDVIVGRGTMIGAGAVILHTGISIGRNAVIGAGAVILRDVPDGYTAVGNPARYYRKRA